MVMLAMRVPYHPGETPASLVSRLAARNRRPTARLFASEMGIPFDRVLSGRMDDLRQLAELADVDFDILLRSAPVSTFDKRFSINQQLFAWGTLQRHLVRICLRCLIEDRRSSLLPEDCAGYGRIEWQINSLRSCPAHRLSYVILPAKIPGPLAFDFSGQIRHWSTKELEDMADLQDAAAQSDFEDYLRHRLNGSRQSETWLDQLELGSAAKSCEVLGTIALPNNTRHPAEFTTAECAEAGALGFKILRDGQASFEQFLSGQSYEERRAIINGRAFAWFAAQKRNSDYRLMLDLMRKVLCISPLPKKNQPTPSRRKIAKKQELSPSLIYKIFPSVPAQNGSTSRLNRHAAETRLAELRARRNGAMPNPRKKTVPIRDATIPLKCAAEQIVDLILKKQLSHIELRPNPSSETPFNICVNPVEVAAELAISNSGGLPVTLMGRALCLPYRALASLIRIGMLTCVDRNRNSVKIPPMIVEARAFRAFQEEYISARDIGASMPVGTTSRTVKRQLKNLGIEPLAEFEKFGGIVYRRKDIPLSFLN